jgi:hypothetical protein
MVYEDQVVLVQGASSSWRVSTLRSLIVPVWLAVGVEVVGVDPEGKLGRDWEEKIMDVMLTGDPAEETWTGTQLIRCGDSRTREATEIRTAAESF